MLVKFKAGNRCEVCGKTRPEVTLNSHHIIGRKFLPYRHDSRNGVSLCVSHHQFSPAQCAHSNPIWFQRWLSFNRTKDLSFISKNYIKAIQPSYEDTFNYLSKEIKKYQHLDK